MNSSMGIMKMEISAKYFFAVIVLSIIAAVVFVNINVSEGIVEQNFPPTPDFFRGTTSFNLKNAIIPEGEIQGGGVPKDGIPALTNPKFMIAEEAEFLNPDDWVIGVTMGGQSKAYPLKIIVWHEIVNDFINDTPIAVTYCPLCQSTLVFNRQQGDQVKEFGVSGLLWNSNVLMYDRIENTKEESLWSQAFMKAVTGPESDESRELELLHSELTTWQDWHSRNLATQVLSPDTGVGRDYVNMPYGSYFSSDKTMFPVKEKIQRPKRFANKELMVIVKTETNSKAYAIKDVARVCGEKGWMEDNVGNEKIHLTYIPEGPLVRVRSTLETAKPPAVAYIFWFALSAMQSDVEIFRPSG